MSLHAFNPLAHVVSRSSLNTASWCEEHIYMSPRVPTAEPGAWKRENVAAWCIPRGPLESLDNPDVECVVVVAGAQVAKTTTGYCWLMKCQSTDPGSALIAMNSATDAKEKSDETWRPLWEDSPKLRRYMAKNRRKDWTKLFQRCNGAPVYWVGANSPGRLGAKPIRRLIVDERDKYPRQFKQKRDGSGKSEAGAAELVLQRVKTFKKKGLAKIFMPSTPTDDRGIWQDYLQGDQRKLFVKCPFCKQPQIMEWASFKLDMAVAKENPSKAIRDCHYECTHCKHIWTDDDRYKAIDAGEWAPTVKPKDPKRHSFQMPSWTSKFVTHSYLATQWIGAQSSQSKLQDFINSEKADPFFAYENIIADSIFLNLEGNYVEGEDWTKQEPYSLEVKEKENTVIGGCDVQKGYVVPVFRRFVDGGDSGCIWAGDAADLQALDRMAEKFDVKYIFIDARYRTHEINEWCFSHRGYIPCMGITRRSRSLFTVSTLNIDEGKRGEVHDQGRVIETCSHDPDMLKDILAIQIQRAEGCKRWIIPRGYATYKDYIKQMTAEKNINGRWLPWPSGAPNHIWDAENLCLLGAIRLGIFTIIDIQQKEDTENGDKITHSAEGV